jgi:hypothetical protein
VLLHLISVNGSCCCSAAAAVSVSLHLAAAEVRHQAYWFMKEALAAAAAAAAVSASFATFADAAHRHVGTPPTP